MSNLVIPYVSLRLEMFFVRLILDLIYLTSDYQPNFFIILLALKDTLSLFLAVALQVISQPLHHL